jgi:hypothetical protein
LEFCDQYRLAVGVGFGLLAGSTGFTNIQAEFLAGNFKIKDRPWADAVAGVYSRMTSLNACLRTSNFIGACMAVCRVDGFDPGRLVQNAKRCREKLVAYSTRDAFLELLETIYNFGRKMQMPLKFAAIAAMRERNPGKKKDTMVAQVKA